MRKTIPQLCNKINYIIPTEAHDMMRNKDKIMPNNTNEKEKTWTFGEKLADRIAAFGGSWTFLITFFCLLLTWILANLYLFKSHPPDPYPFILLNLILSCLAAVQAPIIMMSQNRQEQKDRRRAEYDYHVNIKAEREIRALHEKLDLQNKQHQEWQNTIEKLELTIETINARLDEKNKSL